MRSPSRCLALASLGALGVLAACAAGPHQLRRTVDDFDHQTYVNSPWFNAAMWVVPVIPVTYVAAFVCDFCVTDPWAFWFHDAWDGKGTGYEHLTVPWTDGRMGSMLSERSGWTRVER